MCQSQTTPAPEAHAGDQVAAISSSGFHIVEIHAPTVGIGFLFLAVLLALIFIALFCYKRWVTRHRRPPVALQHYEYFRHPLHLPSHLPIQHEIQRVPTQNNFQRVTENIVEDNEEVKTREQKQNKWRQC